MHVIGHKCLRPLGDPFDAIKCAESEFMQQRRTSVKFITRRYHNFNMLKFESVTTVRANGELIEVNVKRQDTMRGRLRTTAPDGEDIIIELPRGKIINDGDMFGPSSRNKYYVIKVEPETVLKVGVEKKNNITDIENNIKLGYNLGNHHLEVLIEGEHAYVTTGIGLEKVQEILKRSKLPLKVEVVQKIVSTTAIGYFAGEEEE